MVVTNPSPGSPGAGEPTDPTGPTGIRSSHSDSRGGTCSIGPEIRRNLLAAGVPLLNDGVPPDPSTAWRVEMPMGMAVSCLIGELNRLPADAVLAEASGDADMTAVFYTGIPSGRGSEGRPEFGPAAGHRGTARRTDERHRNAGRPHGDTGQERA